MKKIIFLVVILCKLFIGNNLLAGGLPYGQLEGRYSPSWTPIQLYLVPDEDVQLLHSKTPVYGVALGWMLTLQNDVAGLHIAPFAGTQSLYGISIGLINWLDYNYGLTLGLVNIYRDFSALSIGAINYSNGSIYPFGIDIGLLNMGANSIDIGIVNLGDINLQIGVFNAADAGLQFGLLNYNKNSLIPYMPLLNWGKFNKEIKVNHDD